MRFVANKAAAEQTDLAALVLLDAGQTGAVRIQVEADAAANAVSPVGAQRAVFSAGQTAARGQVVADRAGEARAVG